MSNLKPTFDNKVKLRRNLNQLYSEIDDEIIMLSVNNGEYYGLNSIGSEIWNLLEESITFQELVEQLLSKFEVDKDTCIIETADFLELLFDKSLIEFTNE